MTAFKILFFLLVICLCGFDTNNCLDAVKSHILNHRDMVKRAVTEKSGFTAEEATGIVDRHNELRTSEQSSDMLNITWNSVLETSSQTHAAKCNFSHSSDAYRSNVGEFSYAGENLYASSGTSLNVTVIVDYWYSEKSDYNYDNNTCTKVCGHYTQVVWANSTAIGCGVQFCPVLASSSMNSYFVVCQYGPGGNVNNLRPYTKGALTDATTTTTSATMGTAATAKSGFNATEVSGIVSRHNKLRANEPSTDMLNMTWNTALESNAQRHASRCNFSHSSGANRTNVGEFSYAGENLYASSGTLNVNSFVDSWYSEKSQYNYDANSCSGTCGHYTQVVWANSTGIGCGVQFCPVLASSSMKNSYFVVCQYGPGGNIAGKRPFTKASSSGHFPPNLSLTYTSLALVCFFMSKAIIDERRVT